MDDEPYPNLLKEKGGTGFPTLAFLDAKGDVIAKPKSRTVAAYEEAINTANEFKALKAKAASGDKDTRFDVLITELGFGSLRLDEAKKRLAELGQLPSDKAAKIDDAMTSFEIGTLSREAGRDEVKRKAMNERFVEMMKAGKVPKDDAARTFWPAIMTHAEQAGDKELFQKALAAFKEKYGKEQNMQRQIQSLETRLEKMKADK